MLTAFQFSVSSFKSNFLADTRNCGTGAKEALIAGLTKPSLATFLPAVGIPLLLSFICCFTDLDVLSNDIASQIFGFQKNKAQQT